jgi:hypothetical protein
MIVVLLVVQKILQKFQIILKMEICIAKITVLIVKNFGIFNFKFNYLEFSKLLVNSI